MTRVDFTNDNRKILPEVEAIRVMEGNPGHYMGTMTNSVGPAGVAYTPGFSSVSLPNSGTIAHELGHNISLYHRACGGAGAPDPHSLRQPGRSAPGDTTFATGEAWFLLPART